MMIDEFRNNNKRNFEIKPPKFKRKMCIRDSCICLCCETVVREYDNLSKVWAKSVAKHKTHKTA